MRRRMMSLILPFIAWLCAAPATGAVSCSDWNTAAFFKRASAEDVSRCLKAGANVNAGKGGVTPLHVAAAYNRNPAVVRTLLEAGADAAARDSRGRTPFDYMESGIFGTRSGGNPKLKGTDVYWRLSDGRFK